MVNLILAASCALTFHLPYGPGTDDIHLAVRTFTIDIDALWLQMFVYHFVMALLTIGICVCCGMLWPQFKIQMYPQFAVSTVSRVWCDTEFTCKLN